MLCIELYFDIKPIGFLTFIDVVDSLMSFFLSLFQGLRVQMGVPFAEQTIQTFMTLFTQYVVVTS